MMRTLVGVDLGGTLIRAAVATGPTTHGTPVRRPTPAADGPEAVLDTVAEAVREAAAGAPIHGVVIGIPGPLDPTAGRVYAAPNLHGWTDVPAQQMLVQRLDCPVTIQNDANLAGYAEWRAGAGVGTHNLVFLTVSTGIGGALILDGELYSGIAGTAGELGHVLADPAGASCSQGHPGCLEALASGTAIAHRARAALAAGEASTLRDLTPEAIDARAVEVAANAGDALALRLYTEAGHALALAIGGIINALSPEIVVIGGGLSQVGDLLFSPLRAALPQIAFAVPLSRCRVVPAGLGPDAGLVGATAWAVRRYGH